MRSGDKAPEVAQPGHTYTEAFRHECEVRFVAGLPTRDERRTYLDGGVAADGRKIKSLAQLRGEAAAQRLRDDVVALFDARKAGRAPSPQGVGQAGEGGAVHRRGEQPSVPAGGSSLGAADAGNSDPVGSVDSGVAA